MKIKVIGVGKIKQKELLKLIDDYTKQIKDITIIEIPDEKDIVGMDKEGKQILSKIEKEDYVVALAIEGKQLDSEGFADVIDKVSTFHSSSMTFIIGGSYGLSDFVKQRADLLLSFSKMTFPHQLMRLMLIEQIYRAFTIISGVSYHK